MEAFFVIIKHAKSGVYAKPPYCMQNVLGVCIVSKCYIQSRVKKIPLCGIFIFLSYKLRLTQFGVALQ